MCWCTVINKNYKTTFVYRDMTKKVCVICGEFSERGRLEFRLDRVGYSVRSYECAESFAAFSDFDICGCIFLELHPSGLDGLKFQSERRQLEQGGAIVYVTEKGSMAGLVFPCKKYGAGNVSDKTASSSDLPQELDPGFRRNGLNDQTTSALDRTSRGLEVLTAREREILDLAMAGNSNKHIARILNISYRTVELHRSHILKKTGKRNMLELAQAVTGASRVEHSAALRNSGFPDFRGNN